MTITKAELVECIVQKYPDCNPKLLEESVNSIIEYMSQSLTQGQRIEIRGFGSFSLHFRKKRSGRNPRTGETVDLESKFVPHFKPGKALRERVNDSMYEEIERFGKPCIAGQGKSQQS